MQGVFKSNRTGEVFTTLAGIVIGIIIFTSVFVIRNSFNISLTEKTKELGMIASVGATSKQIRNSILFEGMLLGLIAIPIGIVIGIVAIGIVLLLVNYLMTSGGSQLVDNFNLQLQISPLAIIIAAVLAIIMILISVIKPAIRASRISPIDAIRESKDIKITNKKLKISPLTKKIFGVEAEIASKNFKRSKKKYRTTIFSIILSIVLFISMNSIIENGFKLTNYTYGQSEENVSVHSKNYTEEETMEYFNKIKKLENIEKYAILKSSVATIDREKYVSEEEKQYMGEESNNKYTINIYAVGDELYKQYVEQLGLNIEDIKNKAILYDTSFAYVYEENRDGTKRVEYNSMNCDKGDILEYQLMDDPDKNMPIQKIEIALKTKETPMALFKGNGNASLIVSDEMMKNFEDYTISTMLIKSNDPDKLTEDIIKIDETNKNNIYNQNQQKREENNMILIISIFLYGFIAVISIIGITNIFNTITTNMALRYKEFAVLKSIGMTDKEFKKMIYYESILYGTKSLIIGIPIGLLLSYWIYNVMGDIYSSDYIFPIVPVMISIVFVFAIIFITMRYSAKKSDKLNIIETIRKENV